jgi:hypothetical protein
VDAIFRARHVAEQCLWEANSVINAAHSEPREYDFCGRRINEFRLAAEIESFCGFLAENESAVVPMLDAVETARSQVTVDPVVHQGRMAASAHRHAWNFAHRVWLAIANVLDNLNIVECLDAGLAFAPRDGFRLNRGLLDRHWEQVRDKLRTIEPADVEGLRVQLQMEAKRAGILKSDTKSDTQKNPKKIRPLTADARMCIARYKRAIRTGDKLPMKQVVFDYAEENEKSAASIMRVLNDNPEAWKDDKKTTGKRHG